MAVLSKISVGAIFYYIVDDKPTHSAPKGSVSIMDGLTYDNTLFFTNTDGGTTWLKTLSPAYGIISTSENTNTVDFDTLTIGSWYAWNSSATYTLVKSSSDFSLQSLAASFGGFIRYDGNNLIRALVRQTSTNRSGASKWISWRVGLAKNFSAVGLRYSEFFANDNAALQNASAMRIHELNSNDAILPAISPVSREAGGGAATRSYISKDCSINVIKIDEALSNNIFLENWGSNSFTTNSWTVVNDTTNVWVIGTAQNATTGGTYGAYISNNGGVSAGYTATTANVSHFYRDFTIPSGVDAVYLIFKWKAQGQNTAGTATATDYGTVVMTDTTVTPTAGAEVSTAQATAGGNGRLGGNGNLGKFNLGYGINPGTTWNTESINLTAYRGQTKRIVFSWRNDATTGANPGFVVDDIMVVEYKW